ncbi:hypothetical protein [Erythrobacter ani]|uniref:Uncharacterized protein n=1 Tax=Erythrobacter ani TaxID=2827235 RepID=A0ABS6SNE6_9SPHN|nr:hypothetical protein [Erythrobacter ani]MBV7266553.1 hypothetical protein [Erythrobacter ani]
MYSFFDLGGTAGARIAAGLTASIITVALMAFAIVPASPATPFFAGVLA